MQYLVSQETAQTTYMWGTFYLMAIKNMEKKTNDHNISSVVFC